MGTRRPKVYQPPGPGLIIAGHESPYKFDEPSLDFLRKGQGANSFSSGVYAWTNPAVGREYNEEFSQKAARLDPAMQDWWRSERDFRNYQEWKEDQGSWANADFLREWELLGLPLPTDGERQLLANLRKQAFAKNREAGKFGTVSDRAMQLWGGYAKSDQWPASIPYYEALRGMIPREAADKFDRYHNAARALYETHLGNSRFPDASRDAVAWSMLYPHFDHTTWGVSGEPSPPGPMPTAPPAFTYQFNIKADRSDFPDFTQSILRQEPDLRRALLDAKEEIAPEVGNNIRLSHLYDWTKHRVPDFGGRLLDGRTVPMRMRESDAHPMLGEFESALADRGIPGIRYPDSESRKLPAESPSRTENFVVYDPSLIEIAKRYPFILGGILAGGAAAGSQEKKEDPFGLRSGLMTEF